MKGRKKINEQKLRRKRRVRARLLGTSERPRLSIFRSNRHIYAQLIDDVRGITLVSASSLMLNTSHQKIKKVDVAKDVGRLLAEKAKSVKITKAVTDRGFYKYHGRVKAMVEGAREGGLNI